MLEVEAGQCGGFLMLPVHCSPCCGLILNLRDAWTDFHQKVPVLQENGEGTDESWKQRALSGRTMLRRTENKHDLCWTCTGIQKYFNTFQDISYFTLGQVLAGRLGRSGWKREELQGSRAWGDGTNWWDWCPCSLSATAGLAGPGDHMHQSQVALFCSSSAALCHVSQHGAVHISYKPGAHQLHVGLVGSSTAP